MREKREVVELYDGITFKLPPVPQKNEIIGSDLPIKQQKWRRIELPKGFENWSAEKQKPIADLHWKYRWDGLWFMNNGIPTYITGKHFWYLNWSNTNFGYPDFRDIDKRAYYMWEVVEKDPKCVGLLRLKFRRLGATTQGESLAVYYGTGYYRVHCGLVSKTGDDAEDSFANCIDMLYDLPDFFKPYMKGANRKDRPTKEVIFMAPGGAAETQESKLKSLKSKINYRNTTKNAYDSKKLKFGLFDEGGKFEKIKFDDFWDIHRSCMVTGSVVRGKAYVPSTMNEANEANGAAYHVLWGQSDPNEKDANGQTASGLYRLFNPAYDGFEGYIDEYGMSIIETPTPEQVAWLKKIGSPNPYIGAKEYLINRRLGKKNNPRALAEEKRQYPFSPEEAFRQDAKRCLFDSEKILSRIEELENPAYNSNYAFNLQWKNGVQDSEVVIIPTKAGKFEMGSIGIPIELQNKVQRHFDSEGRLVRAIPLNTAIYVMGADPYSQNKTTDKKGSNAGAHVFRLYDESIDNPIKPIPYWETNRFIVEYSARPDSIFIFYEDMIMLASLFGCLVNPEKDNPGLMHWFQQRGYDAFLMSRPEVTHTSAYTRSNTSPGTPASQMTTATGVNYIEDYIARDINGVGEGHGYCCLIDFKRTLEDWLKFELTETRVYDLTMSSIYTFLGVNRHVKKRKPKVKLDGIFATYDNKGVNSEYRGIDT